MYSLQLSLKEKRLILLRLNVPSGEIGFSSLIYQGCKDVLWQKSPLGRDSAD